MDGENTDYSDDRSRFRFVDMFLLSALYNKSDTDNSSFMFHDLRLITRMLAGITTVFLFCSGLIFIYELVVSNAVNILILGLIALFLTALYSVRRD